MAGQPQFNTIRDEGDGQLRQTTPEEKTFFQQKFAAEQAKPGALTERDQQFQAENGGAAQGPPPLPRDRDERGRFLPNQGGAQAPPVQPLSTPPEPDQDFTGQGAAAGGAAGGLLGPAGAAVGAAVGAGAGFIASQSFKKSPIGSLEGTGQTGGGDQDVLRQLLAVQRGIARVGSPIKGAITTTSAGARL